jgi:hypothetical protein
MAAAAAMLSFISFSQAPILFLNELWENLKVSNQCYCEAGF